MNPGKRARTRRTIGLLRAIDAVLYAVSSHTYNIVFPRCRLSRWRLLVKDTAARGHYELNYEITMAARCRAIDLRGDFVEVCDLAKLTGLEILRRHLRRHRRLTWAVVSDAVKAVRRVMRTWKEDG